MFNIFFASSHYLLHWPPVPLRPVLITSVFNVLLPSTVFAMHLWMKIELTGNYTHPTHLFEHHAIKICESGCVFHPLTTVLQEIPRSVLMSIHFTPWQSLWYLLDIRVSGPYSFCGYARPRNSKLCHPSHNLWTTNVNSNARYHLNIYSITKVQ